MVDKGKRKGRMESGVKRKAQEKIKKGDVIIQLL